MNIAILYDAKEISETTKRKIPMEEDLYIHSLKKFYLHPDIQCIVWVWEQKETVEKVLENVCEWELEYGVCNPIWMIHGDMGWGKILDRLKKEAEKQCDLYLFHDIRYPFVTMDMIYDVVQKAAIYGVAGIACEIEDDLVLASGKEILEKEGLCYMRYPVAVRAGHAFLKEMRGKKEVLKLAAEQGAYLCKTKGRNLVLHSEEMEELAEEILQMNKKDFIKCDMEYRNE